MPRETLLSAARRMERFVNIDAQKGGFLTEDTLRANITLHQQLNLAREIIKDAKEICRSGEGAAAIALLEERIFDFAEVPDEAKS